MEKSIQRKNSEGPAKSGRDMQPANAKNSAQKTPRLLANPLQLYLQEIGRYELLSREEEKKLAVMVREHDDQEAAHKLVTANLRLVVKIAMDFRRHWPKNILELIQEGNLGLIKAAKKYDPYRGTKFSYYASFWIKAYMLKFIVANWKLIKIGTTVNQRKLFFNLAKEREKMLAQGRVPQPKLLAERLKVKETEVVDMSQRLGSSEISIERPLVKEGSGDQYRDILPDPGRDAEERISEKQRREVFSRKMNEFRQGLPLREADIFDKRMAAENPETLRQLGDRYGISGERVRQVEAKILNNAKKWLELEIPNFVEDYREMAG